MALLDDVSPGMKYRLVQGNTGTGIFNEDGPYDQYIDISGVPELFTIGPDPFIVGGGVSLGDFINECERQAAVNTNYFYAAQIAAHIKKV